MTLTTDFDSWVQLKSKTKKIDESASMSGIRMI